MSLNAAEIGRVQSMKSKFENLNTIESLDISSATIPIKCHRPPPKFLFKRSSTAIDIPIKKAHETNGRSTNIHNNNGAMHKNYLRRHNELDEPVIMHAIKKRSLIVSNAEDTLKPLKEIKENVEMRLTRHTNDPVKRSSIKRSPAFRVGDKSTSNSNSNCSANSNNNHSNNNNNSNNNSSNKCDKINGKANSAQKKTVQRSLLDESNKKFDEFLKRCGTETQQKLHEITMTDTLKAFLRQPLPSGPPPKKPPRTFCDGPTVANSANSTTTTATTTTTTSTTRTIPIKMPSTTGDVQQKIDLLKSKLVLKPAIAQKPNDNTVAVKEKLYLSGALLNCIPCTQATTYDSVIVTDRNHYSKTVRLSRERVMLDTTNGKKTMPSLSTSSQATVKQRLSNGRAKDEPVYMEPFSHLRGISNAINVPAVAAHASHAVVSSIAAAAAASAVSESNHTVAMALNHSIEAKLSSSSMSNGSLDGGESLGSSLLSNCTSCTADDHSLLDAHDIHYMCTNIENKIKSSDSDSNSNENDHSIPLTNTYDEINILVNAAFGQRKVKDDTLRIGTDSIDTASAMSTQSVSNGSNHPPKTAIRLCRKLTEKRKDYVRRVSAVKNQMPDDMFAPNDSPHQTFKPSVFRTFSIDDTNLNEPDLRSRETDCDSSAELLATAATMATTTTSISPTKTPLTSPEQSPERTMDEADATTDCIETDANNTIDIEPNKSMKLFQVCLLIGYNSSTRQAYIKSKFPADEDVPPNIEQLVFPSTNTVNQTRRNQDYTIVLTDSDGYHVYGYCRRILPESCEICLPLAYCIISEMRAPGFYFKILKEIETRHGQAEFQTNYLLENLQNRSVPRAGQFLHLKLPLSPKPKTISSSTAQHKMMPKRLNLDANPKWLTESAAQAAFNTDNGLDTLDKSRKDRRSHEADDRRQTSPHSATFDLSLINRSLLNDKCDEILIRRPNDLRLESTELSDVYKALGPDLLTIVFSSLLLERKVILCCENISVLSSSILGLQTLLYPFQWQHALITILPQNLVEICQAPIPVLAGILEPIPFDIEDGIVIDLNKGHIVQKCGDETTILPSTLADSLRVSLQMVDLIDQGRMLSSVLIAEAFLRCFVELFVGYKHKHYDKKLFIESHLSQSYRLFLEWFVETAMFRHFVHHKFAHATRSSDDEIGVETTFYDLFESRILKSESDSNTTQHNIEMIMKKCRVIKKKKTFKDRFKDFFGNSNSNG